MKQGCWLAINIIMISLEIAISNFKSINYQDEPTTSLSFKFGQISTVISLNVGEGGKCLYLSISAEQLQDMYRDYACGLFILNRSGKFFSLLSFENMKIEDKVICNQIVFCNDLREVKYQAQFSFVVKGFKNPKIADTAKIQARQKAMNMLKKPQIPKQSPPKQKSQKNQNKKQVTSFLYGDRSKQIPYSANSDNLQTLKEDLRRQGEVKSRLQKQKSYKVELPKPSLSKAQQYFDQNDPFQNNPPVMQFTNDEPESVLMPSVPQVDYMTYEQSIQRSKQARDFPKPPKQNNFLTFNKYDKAAAKDSPQKSQAKGQKNSKVQPSKRELSKQQIKQLAKEQALNQQVKENVMIPIARNGKFELLPLSALRPDEIIEYVQGQKRNEEQAQAFELRKKKLQERQRELEEKNRKLQQLAHRRETEKDMVRRPSKQIRQSVHKEIKEQDNDEQQEQTEQDYSEDFQSMSASNSIIKSRLSSRGNQRNISKEQESIMEDEYSQQFDSYSHSALNKSNQRNPTHSISDYSQSYRSISQSYRK